MEEKLFGEDGGRLDPFAVCAVWLKKAAETEPHGGTAAMLATADAKGRPSVRAVLLKEFDTGGFVFYTNTKSRKGYDLAENPQAALNFYWPSLERQLRIEGGVTAVADAEADEYFASRPRGSRIASIASDQSSPLERRDAYEEKIAALEVQYAGTDDIPRPAHWSGYRLAPLAIEFWQGEMYRAHRRRLFTRPAPDTAGWHSTLLYP
ncbi:MAG: pyridoxamine 5'-phosphate oxidase [Micavibrio sp.]|nr:MAG: pyridoxamine 5'-phosphate oxidase [Micavibrio sp.]